MRLAMKSVRGGKEEYVKRMLCVGVVLVALVSLAASAGPWVRTGDVVLTISGPIFLMNTWDEARSAGVCQLDLDMLKALPATTYTVTDPWLGEKKYTGVLLSDLLKWVAIDVFAQKAVVVASDAKEFVVEIKDANQYPIMIAYASNDKVIKASSGGPLKLVFPYQIEGVEALYAPEQWSWYVVEIRVDY